MKKFLSGIVAAALAVTAISATASAWIDPDPSIWDVEKSITNDILKDAGVDESKYAEGATVTVEFKITGDYTKAEERVAKTNIWDGKDNHELTYYHEGTCPDKFDDRVVIANDETEFNKSVTVTVGDVLEVSYAGNEGFALVSITLKDGDGNVFATYADGKITLPAAEEEQTTENNQEPEDTTAAAATTDPADGKPTTDTGIEGVAVVMGAAVLAAGAIIISKKRK